MAGRRPALHTLDDAFNIRSIFAIRPVAHAGMPAPHWHPLSISPLKTRSGWFSHTQPRPWQTEHFTSVIIPKPPGLRPFHKNALSGEARAEVCQTGTDIPPHLAFQINIT